MEIRPIHTPADHRAALREISHLVDPHPARGTAEGDPGDLGNLVEAYEARHVPVGKPDPIEAIKFRMEQAGLTPKDLATANRAAEPGL